LKPTSGTPHAQLALGVHHLNAAVNLGLAAAKIAVGLAAGSPSLVAHGVENAADLLSNVLAWVGQRIALRPPDEDHHYGHGNAEALTAVGIGVIILVGGLGVAFGAATGRMAGGDAESPQGLALALAVAALSAIACEALARYDARAAAALSSPILKALARDKRSDALTSLIVMAGISGTYLGLDLAETVIAVGVGLWICAIGGRSISEGLDILMDRVPDIALREQLRASACAVAGVEAVDEVRIHPLGTVCRVEMEISVAGGLSVSEGHHIAHEVEDSITRSHGRIVQVAVHVNPA
jgi:cation diffusion facilitator family transporter